MKNVIRSVSGFAAYVVGILFLSCHAAGDFQLRIDGNTLRELNSGSYEIDAFIDQTPVGTPATIQSLLLNLAIAPANGYSLDDITGVQFNGLRNPDSNTLFTNPRVRQTIASPLSLQGSLFSTNPVSTPSSSRLAFTVLFSTSRGSPSDVQIKFESAGNFYEIDRFNEGNVYNFAGLFSSSPITIVKVPEPSSCVLAAIALAGISLKRRFLKRSSKA